MVWVRIRVRVRGSVRVYSIRVSVRISSIRDRVRVRV
jgi:hypothetical protein